jgi:hypothetical protein
VSGPKVVNISKPPGASTRRSSVNTGSWSWHHCSIKLEKMSWKLPAAKGNRSASPQTQPGRRNQPPRRRAWRSMLSARSRATTSALR